jgi:MFS family permease
MLLTRRFLPYFATQCLGALNDNVYKNVLLLLVAYSQVDQLPMGVDTFVNLAAGVFILPFFLFSAHAGLVADNMDKAVLIRALKLLELFIMSCAAVAILTESYLLMLLLLFLTGSQSAYFGPVKYSLLPRALDKQDLVRGNAWVELGTFLSILLGTLSAGLLVASRHGLLWSAITVALLALLGYLASRAIPSLPPKGKTGAIPFRPLSGAWRTMVKARQDPAIWMAILAISWFWFLGASYLTQFPNFVRLQLQSGPSVVSVLLALFSVGIAIGSLLCARLSGGRVEMGIVPFGVLGLTLFGIDLYSAVPPAEAAPAFFYGIRDFVMESGHYRVMLDLFMIGVSGGLYIVPLYAFIQSRAPEGECAQAIAANNIVNALFMVCAAIMSILLLGVLDWHIPRLFLLISLINALVGLYVFVSVPEFGGSFLQFLRIRT